MQKTKVIQLLRGLKTKELKQFKIYVASPYFNTNKRVIRLLDFLIRFAPHFTNIKCSKENGYAYVFETASAYHDQKMRNVFSVLTRLAEGFIWQQEIQLQPNAQSPFLLEGLYKRQLDKQFVQHLKTIRQQQAKEKQQDIPHFYERFQLADLTYTFGVATQHRSALSSDLQAVTNHLDVFYIGSKLRYACAMLNQKSILEVSHQLPIMTTILTYLEQNTLDHIPLIGTYYRLYKLLQTESTSNYQNLNDYLQANHQALPKSELRQVYTALFNYCNKQLKTGKDHYLRTIFELYQLMLAQEILIADGFISPYQHYRNVVIAALKLKEIAWANQFIEDYKDKLRPEHRENMYHYCKAALLFYQNQFHDSLQHLLYFEFTAPYHYVEHKTLLAKTYFELAEWEALNDLLQAFKTYLRRNKQLPSHFKQG
ncbi:MAG: hypothetical protein ACPGXL_07165, partial [Chitinophagales bacterium]